MTTEAEEESFDEPGSVEAAGAEVVLALDGVSRVYGTEVQVRALDDVSLDIRAGEYLSIVGPSGSGKSTLLGLLGVLDLPTAGTIRVWGVDVSRLPDAERSRLRGEAIGFVFQQFHLIPHLTALGNVETALLYRGLSSRQRRQQALDALQTQLADGDLYTQSAGDELAELLKQEGQLKRELEDIESEWLAKQEELEVLEPGAA